MLGSKFNFKSPLKWLKSTHSCSFIGTFMIIDIPVFVCHITYLSKSLISITPFGTSCSLPEVPNDVLYLSCSDYFIILLRFLSCTPVMSSIIFLHLLYSETTICCSQIIRFPGSVVQFLWSLSESYFNYGSLIYCFPGSIVSFSDPRRKR
jgi:hypothetical protein